MPAPSRTRRRRRLVTALTAALAIAALTVGGIALVHARAPRTPVDEACHVAVGTSLYRLELDQAQNAATIAAVARREQLPDHAITVAIATALQESRLHNLPYGDRDSLGLFQQRPSQGWGTSRELLDPAYAANAFYKELQRVRNWDHLAVTVAAQRVQRSAAPDAYAQWESEARDLAVALTTDAPRALTCRYAVNGRAPTAPSYADALQHELGIAAVDDGTAHATRAFVATWLVAHAHRFGLRTVAFDGAQWTARSGHWAPHSALARADTGPTRGSGIIVT